MSFKSLASDANRGPGEADVMTEHLSRITRISKTMTISPETTDEFCDLVYLFSFLPFRCLEFGVLILCT